MNKLKITKICAIVLASLLAIGMLVPAAVYVFAADEKCAMCVRLKRGEQNEVTVISKER